jgi:predicted nucleic acid-binding protein
MWAPASLADSADAAIGVTAAVHDAALLTRSARGFAGMPGLRVGGIGAPGSG